MSGPDARWRIPDSMYREVYFHATKLAFLFFLYFFVQKMIMKRKIYFLCGMFIITALFTLSFIILKSKNHNDIFRANVEALTLNEETIDKCKGCSTEYNGEHCCTMIFNGVKFELYHRL